MSHLSNEPFSADARRLSEFQLSVSPALKQQEQIDKARLFMQRLDKNNRVKNNPV